MELDGRDIERLIISLGAVLCIYLGYRLLQKGMEGNHSIHVQRKGWIVKFEAFAPGTCFALFGAVLLITSYLNPVERSARVIREAAIPCPPPLTPTMGPLTSPPMGPQIGTNNSSSLETAETGKNDAPPQPTGIPVMNPPLPNQPSNLIEEHTIKRGSLLPEDNGKMPTTYGIGIPPPSMEEKGAIQQ